MNKHVCSGLEKSPFGAKSDFEIWAFKGFLYLDKKISPKKGLEVSTPKNLKWKKYIRQSENANGGPLWGSKKLKVSTKRTDVLAKKLPFWFGEIPNGAGLRKREKSKRCFTSGREKSPDSVDFSK